MSASFVCIGKLQQIYSHTRFVITLRSKNSNYKSILLFRLASATIKAADESTAPPETLEDETNEAKHGHQAIQNGAELEIYAMEAQCPHLGADLSHAEIEEYEEDLVAVCPWHRYDFNLRTGQSDTGLRACVYKVQIRRDQEGEDALLWIETPSDQDEWELVNISPVSEAFADPPLSSNETSFPGAATSNTDEELVPSPPPNTLLEWAVLILNTSSAKLKVQRTRHAVELFRLGKLKSIGRHAKAPNPPETPPRDAAMVVVDPTKVARRGKGGSLRSRVTMLHALANIEQWAIDLAWDMIARFGNDNTLPHQFYTDFTKMALDESKHFTLLSHRLSQLGCEYGSLPVHTSLWQSATDTADSLLARLAIIHLVHEARGLDVNPVTISKFQKAGDEDSVAVLQIIHLDEITHVTTGHRWFTWKCGREDIDPVHTFRGLVRQRFAGQLKGPFNAEDRQRAGMGKEFYEDLVGERDATPLVRVAYD